MIQVWQRKGGGGGVTWKKIRSTPWLELLVSGSLIEYGNANTKRKQVVKKELEGGRIGEGYIIKMSALLLDYFF